MCNFPCRCLVSALALLAVVPLTQGKAETRFELGGYAKMDVIASDYLDGDPASDSNLHDFHLPSLIPVGGEDGDVRLDFHAKQSRFNLGTTSDLANGEAIKIFFEMDFMMSDAGDERVSNSYHPRLRHAYFSYDGWLFGQTWSTFMITALPESLDFIGVPDGAVFVRQAQVRFTRGAWQFALENPETTLTPYGGGARVTAGPSSAPDMVARYNFTGGDSELSVAALYRRLRYEPAPGDSVTESGYGVTVGGRIPLAGGDDVRFAVTKGRGLGRYVGLNFVNSAVLDPAGDLDTIDTMSGYAAYLHRWHPRWRSTFDVSVLKADNDPLLTGGTANKAARSASVNLLYSPAPDLAFGVELMHAERELENGADGAVNRIQFSAKYDFSFSAGN